ncbi:MAG: 50S ribosomal protein L30 [Theionarchaea archaeon]|nr:50S ribosomal protein L30 [Theionarchaea archaeon]MBU7036323.1 50S ribosomal protein L30 [Theionarchaea archaeon]
MNRIIVVAVRSTSTVRKDIKDTLKMLNLTRINHAVLVDDRPGFLGMLNKAKDYVTYGEIEQPVLEALLSKWARLPGDEKVTEQYVEETVGQTISEFAASVMRFEKELDELGTKPLFRLHPPRKGYKDIKRAFSQGGSVGYRGPAINDLVRRMI